MSSSISIKSCFIWTSIYQTDAGEGVGLPQFVERWFREFQNRC